MKLLIRQTSLLISRAVLILSTSVWKTLSDKERVGVAGDVLTVTSRNKFRRKTKKFKVKQTGKVQAQRKKTPAVKKVATLTAESYC